MVKKIDLTTIEDLTGKFPTMVEKLPLPEYPKDHKTGRKRVNNNG